MGLLLVTGANGFVGRALCAELVKRSIPARAVVRDRSFFSVEACERVNVPNVTADTDWADVLRGVETVIHLAARAHVMRDDSANPLEEFRKVNVAGTEQLARAASASGVKRLIYVSSIKVNGEATQNGEKFTESDVPAPEDPYGLSKWEAEQVLHRVASETGLEIVIVRPPLVYGSNVKGNFALLLKVLRRRLPLPLASVRNLRSLVYVGNLVDALIACVTHPAAAMQTYLVSDGEDVSTPDLLRKLGVAMGRPARLLPCPEILIRYGARLFNKSAQADRLLGSLRLDSSKICRELDWTPPFSLRQGLSATAEH